MDLDHMSLRLRLIKSPAGTRLDTNEFSLNSSGGTIGRANSNTCVLPDPEKYLSSCHCEIVNIEGNYYAIDRSTNGTFLNDSIEPIGRGNQSIIRQGDTLEIGDYRFQIEIQTNIGSSYFEVPPSEPDSLLNNASSFNDVDPFNSDPFAAFNKTPAESDTDNYWASASSFNGNKISSIENSYFDEIERDPFNLDSSSKETLINDLLGNRPNQSTQNIHQPVSDNLGLNQSFDFPEIGKQNLIPDDWDLGSDTNKEEPLLNRSQTILGSERSHILEASSAASHTSPISSKPSSRLSLAERLAAMERSQDEIKQSVSPSTDKMTPAPARKEKNSSLVDNSNFINALGIDKSRLSNDDIREIETLCGLLLREVIDGMLIMLRSRASIKNEFRMNVTTIQPVENNPLKFSVNVDDAIENIFLKKSKAYKPPVEAFREGFQEIADHQIAMIAGIRSGFNSMIDNFNPPTLEEKFSRNTKNYLLSGMNKGRYWNNFVDYSKYLHENLDISFQQLFGNEFVSAYEDQLRRLVNSREKDSVNENVS